MCAGLRGPPTTAGTARESTQVYRKLQRLDAENTRDLSMAACFPCCWCCVARQLSRCQLRLRRPVSRTGLQVHPDSVCGTKLEQLLLSSAVGRFVSHCSRHGCPSPPHLDTSVNEKLKLTSPPYGAVLRRHRVDYGSAASFNTSFDRFLHRTHHRFLNQQAFTPTYNSGNGLRGGWR